VAVNCASVPAALAERLLFGARKGAYSGADSDVQGFVQAADGGTLFLDEIVELSAEVQAKLLRVIETRQVTPLGATQPRPVRLRLVSAGHADLKAAVASGRFREDLYYRVARPLVAVPPLRDRLEDIPWLVQSVLARADRALAAHVSLVEEAMLRPWPGNVRELRSEVGEAARRAAQAGEDRVRSAHLDAGAGRPLAAPAGPARDPLDRAGVEGALRAARGNVSEAARRLGLHRNQLRRWLADNGVDASRMR
jgi:transcriptional regulator with PAS, ATPase and Fis domain